MAVESDDGERDLKSAELAQRNARDAARAALANPMAVLLAASYTEVLAAENPTAAKVGRQFAPDVTHVMLRSVNLLGDWLHQDKRNDPEQVEKFLEGIREEIVRLMQVRRSIKR